MEKISEFRPVTFTPLTGLSKEELSEGIKWWNKHLAGFRQIWDYNADSGLKKIYQKGNETRLVTMLYGDTTIFKISKLEMDELVLEKGDDTDGWERITKGELADMKP